MKKGTFIVAAILNLKDIFLRICVAILHVFSVAKSNLFLTMFLATFLCVFTIYFLLFGSFCNFFFRSIWQRRKLQWNYSKACNFRSLCNFTRIIEKHGWRCFWVFECEISWKRTLLRRFFSVLFCRGFASNLFFID